LRVRDRLAYLSERLADSQANLRITEEQHAYQVEVVDDLRARMLVAETPLADREFRVARDDLERLRRNLGEARTEVEELQAERDRLLDQLLEEMRS